MNGNYHYLCFFSTGNGAKRAVIELESRIEDMERVGDAEKQAIERYPDLAAPVELMTFQLLRGPDAKDCGTSTWWQVGGDQAWALHDCVRKLVEASDILLHEKDYDGLGHEMIATAALHAREYLAAIEVATQPPSPPKPMPYLLVKNGRYAFHNSFGYVEYPQMAELYSEAFAKEYAARQDDVHAIPLNEALRGIAVIDPFIERLQRMRDALSPAPDRVVATGETG